MTEEPSYARAREERIIRETRIAAARLIVKVNKRLREPTDPDIVELSKQTL